MRSPTIAERAHELVYRMASERADAIALVEGDATLRYSDLAAEAHDVAGRLRATGVTGDSRVGVMCTRTATSVAGWIGALTTGASFVPLDHASPPDRIRAIAKIAGVETVLVDRPAEGALVGFARTLEVSRDCWSGRATTTPIASAGDEANVPPTVSANDEAYVLFTSGSGGIPKGVVIGHGALSSRLITGQTRHPLRPGDAMLQASPLTFDVSIWEVFAALTAGARVVVADSTQRSDPGALAQLLASGGVTVAGLLPSVVDGLVRGGHLTVLDQLATIYFGAERLDRVLVDAVWRQRPDLQLFNLYGLTETCIDATEHKLRPGDQGPVPIGTALPNAEVVLLDAQGEIADAEGEIAVGGPCVALGYVGEPELTRQRFIADPRDPGKRLVRTGDRGRWREDGELLLLGRLDRQIKVRGQRVELAEVETHLGEHRAIAIGRWHLSEDQRMELSSPLGPDPAAHPAALAGLSARWRDLRERLGSASAVEIVTEAGIDLDAALISATRTLPAHMVPAAVRLLDVLPSTASGKIDALATEALVHVLGDRGSATADGDSGPVDDDLTFLCSLFADVLGVAAFAAADDFFEFGGESLAAACIAASAGSWSGVLVRVCDVFEARTPQTLLGRIRTRDDPLTTAPAVTRDWCTDGETSR